MTRAFFHGARSAFSGNRVDAFFFSPRLFLLPWTLLLATLSFPFQGILMPGAVLFHIMSGAGSPSPDVPFPPPLP